MIKYHSQITAISQITGAKSKKQPLRQLFKSHQINTTTRCCVPKTTSPAHSALRLCNSYKFLFDRNAILTLISIQFSQSIQLDKFCLNLCCYIQSDVHGSTQKDKDHVVIFPLAFAFGFGLLAKLWNLYDKMHGKLEHILTMIPWGYLSIRTDNNQSFSKNVINKILNARAFSHGT